MKVKNYRGTHLMALTATEKKKMRILGHHLKPVIMVAEKGLTAGVITESERALADHELIKVRFNIADKKIKKHLADELIKTCNAEEIQMIGHILLMYKPAKKPKTHLSNLTLLSVN